MKNVIKAVEDAKTPEEASTAYRSASAVLDKLAAKRIIHKNLAANKKSRLSKYTKKSA